MTIPTRDELIERARSLAHAKKRLRHDIDGADLADFALAEIRRAVAEELEDLHAFAVPRNWDEGGQEERARWSDILSDRLAALREPTKVGEFAGIPIMADPSVKPGTIEARAGNVAAPALSDADVLERAAEIMRSRSASGAYAAIVNGQLCDEAAKLRSASAPVPVPKPVGVFDAFDREWHAWDRGGEPLPLCGLARDWFGPLDQLLSEIEVAPGAWQTRAAATRAALRQRAQEAMPERASDLAARLHEADAAHSHNLWQSELRKARGEQ